ncbi:arsenate reductase (glutaredoxin) [Yoonia sp. MH D7]
MIVIWHNPRCSKSRQTLAILEAKGVVPQVRLYLQDPPSESEIRNVLIKLDMTPAQIVRRGEAEFEDGDADHLITLMAKHPKIIERPIVITDSAAVIARPPENALALFD